jgi:magnesium chelatase family protein
LFLDEIPEYNKSALESLRQPLEDKTVTVSRILKTVDYPARFMLIASMNPCPCGYDGSQKKECTCTELEKRRYRTRISGPMLDRIDIYAETDGVEYSELRDKSEGESSEKVKERITKAREIQLKRFKDLNIYVNADMSARELKRFCTLDSASETLLEAVFKKFSLSARGATRIIKTARTIADLKGAQDISASDIAEAVQYRIRNVQD